MSKRTNLFRRSQQTPTDSNLAQFLWLDGSEVAGSFLSLFAFYCFSQWSIVWKAAYDFEGSIFGLIYFRPMNKHKKIYVYMCYNTIVYI